MGRSIKALGERALYNRLNKYFMEHYGQYEMSVRWHSDDTISKWTCDIKELGITVCLRCDIITGIVTETKKTC